MLYCSFTFRVRQIIIIYCTYICVTYRIVCYHLVFIITQCICIVTTQGNYTITGYFYKVLLEVVLLPLTYPVIAAIRRTEGLKKDEVFDR